MKIGFTERGDAGLDLTWHQKCASGRVDGAVVITKDLNARCREKILDLHAANFPVVVHATCTGWGGSIVEPNVPKYQTQLESAAALVRAGFPLRNLVLRVDPIFPTRNGLARVLEVLASAESLGLIRRDDTGTRIRVSVLDEYPHVRERFRALGFEPIYGGRFQAPDETLRAVARTLEGTGLTFETCAETKLAAMSECLIETGCLSRTDLDLMGLTYDDDRENNQNRSGCHCLGCKTELLTRRHPCGHACQYCFWKRPGE